MASLKLQLSEDSTQRVWITSDIHFHHKNICRGVSDWKDASGVVPILNTRDFTTLEIMDNTIIDNINSCVKQDDILFILGDVSFGGIENLFKFRERIVVKTIYLVRGNHDHHTIKNTNNCQELFTDIFDYLVINYKKKIFVCCHYPIESWEEIKKGSIHLFGHQHSLENKKFRIGKKMDVGLDGSVNFTPYNIDEIIKIMDKRPIAFGLENDHHSDENM